jgi:hypothetical protein
MPDRTDYRKTATRGILCCFFGLLTVMIDPGFDLGVAPYVAVAGALAVAAGCAMLSTLPVTGVYGAFMTAGAVFAGAFAALILALVLAPLDLVPSWLPAVTKAFGALALFSLAAAAEILCRRLKWRRLARAWALSETIVGLIYAAPAVLGCFYDYYADTFESYRVLSALRYELSSFEFPGMHLAGVGNGSPWLVILFLVLLAPAAILLVNLLRTYVYAASPAPPRDDTEPIAWSRR